MVLVAYASKYGSTQGIAERIAVGLAGQGHATAVREVDQVDEMDDYEAVVLGSPVYNGSWLPEAVEFVRRHHGALAARRTWFFSAAAFGDRHPLVGRVMKEEPREMRALSEAARPRGYRVFAGVVEPERWSLIGRM